MTSESNMTSLYSGLTKEGIAQVEARVRQKCAFKRGNDWFCTFHDETALDENGICSVCENTINEIAYQQLYPDI